MSGVNVVGGRPQESNAHNESNALWVVPGACITKATSTNLPTVSRLLPIALLLISGCDPVGRENGRGSAVPEVAPPILSPVEIKPPRIERAPVGRVDLIDPPRVDSIQVDELRQSDGVVDILWVVEIGRASCRERVYLAV